MIALRLQESERENKRQSSMARVYPRQPAVFGNWSRRHVYSADYQARPAGQTSLLLVGVCAIFGTASMPRKRDVPDLSARHEPVHSPPSSYCEPSTDDHHSIRGYPGGYWIYLYCGIYCLRKTKETAL